eukprot:7231221-Alexandrium_andersonii.AAC.1
MRAFAFARAVFALARGERSLRTDRGDELRIAVVVGQEHWHSKRDLLGSRDPQCRGHERTDSTTAP